MLPLSSGTEKEKKYAMMIRGNGAIRNSHSENQCEKNYIDNKVLGILREHFVI